MRYAKPIFRKPASRPHQYSIYRRRFVFGKAVPAPTDAHIGWLVVHMIRRAYATNLRR